MSEPVDVEALAKQIARTMREDEVLAIGDIGAEHDAATYIVAQVEPIIRRLEQERDEQLRRALEAEAERDLARDEIAEAARQIDCAGTVAHRIRTLKAEAEFQLRAQGREMEGLRESLKVFLTPEKVDASARALAAGLAQRKAEARVTVLEEALREWAAVQHNPHDMDTFDGPVVSGVSHRDDCRPCAAKKKLLALAAPQGPEGSEPQHVCGLSGYNGMLDPPCPACELRHGPCPSSDEGPKPERSGCGKLHDCGCGDPRHADCDNAECPTCFPPAPSGPAREEPKVSLTVAEVAVLRDAVESAWAGIWDAYYGKGIAVEYARAVDEKVSAARTICDRFPLRPAPPPEGPAKKPKPGLNEVWIKPEGAALDAAFPVGKPEPPSAESPEPEVWIKPHDFVPSHMRTRCNRCGLAPSNPAHTSPEGAGK